MTPDFYLKPGKSDQATLLLRFSYRGQRIKVSTRIRISRDLWSEKRGAPKLNSSEGIRLKDRLDEIQDRLLKFTEEPRTKLQISQELDLILGISEETPTDFLGAWESYVKEVGKTNKAESYVTRIESSRRLFKVYAEEARDPLTWAKITPRKMDQIAAFYYAKDYAPGTISRAIGHLKSFMKWARILGLHNEGAWEGLKRFTTRKEITYLTKEEIQLLEEASLEIRLRRVVDLFLISCFTGLRYSDLIRLGPANIGADTITIRALKDKDRLEIPISTRARKILDRYPEGLPQITNQKGNEYLKEAVKLIEGMDRQVLISAWKDGRPADTFHPIQEIVSWHMARRTFVTLSLEAGMSPEVIMSITGHSDHASMKPYMEATQKLKMKQFRDAWG